MQQSKPTGLGIRRESKVFASQHDRERLCGHNQFTRRVHGIHTILAHGDTADWSRHWQSTPVQITWSFGCNFHKNPGKLASPEPLRGCWRSLVNYRTKTAAIRTLIND
ncbi:hypothetical protein BaRGS_00027303 [Batillaria attramentaria]|uniref:Uncharacterized protein n=1 Tax=Batillaria attramentaria TaxID=370345 RepID=A0ABD0K2X3_9CAEN